MNVPTVVMNVPPVSSPVAIPSITPLGLGTDEAARTIGISTRKLRGVLTEPDPPPHLYLGRKLIFPRDALLRWLERRAAGGRAGV